MTVTTTWLRKSGSEKVAHSINAAVVHCWKLILHVENIQICII